MERKEQNIGFLCVLGFILGFYVYTMAPTASFWDAGEYLAAGYTLSVPHPPGSPLVVLLRRLFSFLPFGSDPAKGMNFMSTLMSAIGVALIYLIIVKCVGEWRKVKTKMDKAIIHLSGFCGASIAAFSFTPWWNAVEAEDYAPATFVLILVLWLALLWRDHLGEKNSGRMMVLIAYLLALSVGIHLMPLLAGPGILIFALMVGWDDLKDKKNIIFGTIGVWFFIVLLLMALKGPLGDDYSFGIGMVTGVILLAFLPNIKVIKDPRLKFLIAGLILLGFTTHFYLLIRAQLHPMINETAPTTLSKLWDAFSRKQYGPSAVTSQLFPRKTAIQTHYSFPQAFWWQILFYTKYFSWQFVPWPRESIIQRMNMNTTLKFLSVFGTTIITLISSLGIVSTFKHNRKLFWLFFITYFLTSFGLVAYMNFKFSPSDPNQFHQPREVRERQYFFGPSAVLIGLFAGFGVFEIIDRASKRMTLPSITLCTLICLVPLVSNFHSPSNRHGNFIPDDYGYNTLSSCDDGGVLYTNGDNDTFPLWFAQCVKHTKLSVAVANLSLLNTDWYIKQMKEAGVPISFTDFEIENLMPYPQIKDGKPIKKTMLFVKDFAVRDIIATNAGYKFEKKLFMPIKKETLPRKYRLLFPGDMDYIPPQYYVRRIPKKYWVKLPEEYLLPPEDFGKIVLPNYHGKKPIYFAVTVSRDGTRGYENHLRMEGLVKRLVPDGGGFDMERTDSLLNKVYRYRGVFDPSVYKDETTRKILSNYAVAYFALGTEEKRRGEIDRAIDSFEKGQGIGVKEIPFAALLAELYRMKGDYKKVGEILRKAAVNEKTPYSLYALGGLYLDNGKYAQADSCFRKIIKLDEKSSLGYAGLLSLYTLRGNRDSLNQLKNKIVTNPELTGRVVSVLRSQKKGEMAVSLLSRWIEVHPYDTIAKGILKQIEKE